MSNLRITISAQHLTGNDPEGFNRDAWIAALTERYTEIGNEHFPNAEIVVEIDVQRASGNARPAACYADSDDVADVNELIGTDDWIFFQREIDNAANALYDDIGAECY